jgi:predicted permease
MVVLTLGLAIGAGTAVFSIVDGVLVRPLSYQDPERLVRLAEGYEGATALRAGARFSNVTFHQWRDAGFKTVAALGGYGESGDALLETTDARALTRVTLVTPGLFRLLGASPAVGRLFADDDVNEGAEPVVVLSESLWRERFGGDPAVVGQTARISGQPHRIIGVTPRGFTFPDDKTRFWLAFGIPRPSGSSQSGSFTTFFAVGRLKPDASPSQAAAEGTAVARTIEPKPLAARATFGDGGAAFVRATPLLDEMTVSIKTPLVVVAAGILCILLIACVNASNLLLSRRVARQRELAVLTALGANRTMLARQLLTECLLLSAAGGALGVLLAFWAVQGLPSLAPADFPRLENVHVDLRVLAAAVSLSVLTGLATALVPMLVTRTDVATLLRGAGTGGVIAPAVGAQSQRLLLASQSAFTVVLLIAAVLLGRSFVTLIRVDAGYTAPGAVVADVLRPDTGQDSAQRYATLMRQALDRLASTPGITAVAIGSMTALDSNNSLQAFPIPGAPTTQSGAGAEVARRTALTRTYSVTPGYDRAVGLRVKSGRFLIDADAVGNNSRWVVNEEFARLYLPPNPVGRRFPWRRGNLAAELEIVGVVGNVLKDGNGTKPSPEVYRILRPTEPFYNYQIVARTNGDASAVIPVVRDVIRQIAPDATVNAVPLSQRFSESVAQPRLATTVFAALAVIAASLTAIGLFAALAYRLSQRRREFGVRAALGASRRDLVRLSMREGLMPAGIGIIVGVLAALGLMRFMQAILFGISAQDTVSFVAAPLLLIPCAVAACLLPAVRASRVNPMATLLTE